MTEPTLKFCNNGDIEITLKKQNQQKQWETIKKKLDYYFKNSELPK